MHALLIVYVGLQTCNALVHSKDAVKKNLISQMPMYICSS